MNDIPCDVLCPKCGADITPQIKAGKQWTDVKCPKCGYAPRGPGQTTGLSKSGATNLPCFTDIERSVIADAFLSAIRMGRVKCLDKSIEELENMTPGEILTVLSQGRANGRVIGQFHWRIL